MKNARSSGFTLIELMITVAILAILLMLAVPSFNALIIANRVTSLTNEVVSSLNLARSEAIKRGTRVTVCKSADPAAASPVCDIGATWQTGWVIFVDGGVVGSVTAGDTVFKVGQPTVTNAVITKDVVNPNYISYMSSGASSASGSFEVCLSGVARTISISAMGRTSVSAGTC